MTDIVDARSRKDEAPAEVEGESTRLEPRTTAMHNFELGTAPGFSLLPPCRLQHLVDRRMSTGAFGLLHFGTRLLVDRFAVTRRPHATQQDLQSRDQLFADNSSANQSAIIRDGNSFVNAVSSCWTSRKICSTDTDSTGMSTWLAAT